MVIGINGVMKRRHGLSRGLARTVLSELGPGDDVEIQWMLSNTPAPPSQLQFLYFAYFQARFDCPPPHRRN